MHLVFTCMPGESYRSDWGFCWLVYLLEEAANCQPNKRPWKELMTLKNQVRVICVFFRNIMLSCDMWSVPHANEWRETSNAARNRHRQWTLASDPTFGIRSHKTLDTAQSCHLLRPNWKPPSSQSISIITNISTQFLLQSFYVCVCVCVCVCVFIVCVCFCIVLFFV